VELLVGDTPHQGAVGDAEQALLRSSIAEFSLTRVPGAGYFIQEECPEAIRSAVDRHARIPCETQVSTRSPAVPAVTP
jgi:hypothetical protein